MGLLMETLSIPAAHDRFYADIVAGIEEARPPSDWATACCCTMYRPGVDPIDDMR